jgi:hypothetical protein
MNAPKALLLTLAAAVLIAAGWWYQYVGTPQHSLALLADAVKAKDYETARYFVDDERIADTASKSVFDAEMSRVTKEIKADDSPLAGLGGVALQLMAPRIRETVRDHVKDAIRQALSGDDKLTNAEDAQRWGTNRFSQLRIEQCAVSGNTAEVVIRGIPQPNPAEITEVHLRMARILDSRKWRIEEIPELAQAYLTLLDPGKASAQASDAPNVTQPSIPAVTLSKPNRVLELTSNYGVCGVDYRNAPLFAGDRTVPLRDGKYEQNENPGSDSVTVEHVFCLDHGVAEHALLATDWVSCGASCNSSGMVQVFELRGGHPVVVQQIDFDSDAKGTGAAFDDDSRILTITGRSNEESPHCCAKSLDVVAYRWQGQEFVQSSYKRVPVPPSY